MEIVALGFTALWTAGCALAIRWASRRIALYEAARPGSAGMFCGIVPCGYVVALSSWPIALAVAVWMVRRPELARQGRITLVWVATVTLAQLALWSLKVLASGR